MGRVLKEPPQTFRVLTRLEPKVFGDSGAARGLNLTRASLDASSKYPWFRDTAVVEADGREKFGVYDDDAEVFQWLREGVPDGAVCLEAQVMDLADDVAYSVHDFEDAIVGGFISPAQLLVGLDLRRPGRCGYLVGGTGARSRCHLTGL